jgi:hypothetical protein
MAKRKSKSQPTWTDVKAKLEGLDRAGLLGLIQSLYSAHKDNQTFLHSRFGLRQDVLEPYKKIIDRWLWPDHMLKTAIEQNYCSYSNLLSDPLLRGLHSDRQFDELLTAAHACQQAVQSNGMPPRH